MKKYLTFLFVFIMSISMIQCREENNVIDTLEILGYETQTRDVSYCDYDIKNHYDVYDNDELIGYIYEFENQVKLNDFLDENEHINNTQIINNYVLFLEEEIISSILID